MIKTKEPIIIFGATGFVGTNLIKKYVENKREVIALVRNPQKLKTKSKYLKVIKIDILKPETYREILKKSHLIYYLIHGMSDSDDYVRLESKQAGILAKELKSSHRLIYLSGLGEKKSDHLKSRQKVGNIFRKTSAHTLEVRASIIIGKKGYSFEMIKAIATRFPFIGSAPWSQALCEPIYIDDLVNALVMLAEVDMPKGIYEIGGGEQVKYEQLIILAAEALGVIRPRVSLPFLPKEIVVSALQLMTPEYYQAGKHLLGSIEIPTVVTNKNLLETLSIKPTPLKLAIKKAVGVVDPAHLGDHLESLWGTLSPKTKERVKKGYQLFKLVGGKKN